MASFKLLHCADLHIDSPLRGLEADPDAPADRIRRATREAFSRLVDAALGEGVAVVLIAGDIFDGDWQDWRTGQFFVRELARLTAAGIRVVAVSGNHDAECVLTRKLRWPEGATLLPSRRAGSVRFDDLDLSVHGRSYANRAVTESLLPGYPPPDPGRLNIGLLHTAAGCGGHENYAPCTPEALRAHGYEYWALGHIHARQILCRDPWIVFPGNVQGRHVNEPGAKGATLVTIRDGRVAGEPEHLALDVVRWRHLAVDLSAAGDEDSAHATIRAALGGALDEAEGRLLALRLTLTGATPAHAALAANLGDTREKLRAEAMALGDALWLEQVALRTAPPDAAATDSRIATLLAGLDAAPLEASALKEYAAKLLGVSALRAALPTDHPAFAVERGAPPAELLAEARALLRARLGQPG